MDSTGRGYITFNITVCGVGVESVCELHVLLYPVYIREWSVLSLGLGSILPSIPQRIYMSGPNIESIWSRYGIGAETEIKVKCV